MRFICKVATIMVGIFSLNALTAVAFAFGEEALPLPKYNMHWGVTPLSHAVYNLHMIIFWICVAIGVLVFSFLFYSLIRHRKSKGAVPATFHEHPVIEVIWAIVPLLILIGIAIPATIANIRMYDASDSDITIKVTGYQWKWRYEYLDQGLDFFSSLATPYTQIHNQAPKNPWYLLEVDKPLVLPTQQKIRFLITSNDVIHSWWVPAFGFKKDAIPGFIHEGWARIEKPGVYRGQCAELCGINHGFMPIVIEAKTPEDFQKWVQQQLQAKVQAEQITTVTPAELMKLGETAYNTHCGACHQANGMGIPKVFPALKASSIVVGHPVTRHIDIVLNGIPGTAMQAFGPQLSDLELAAILTYERNAWGNHSGDIIQPSDVKAERQRLQNPAVAAASQAEIAQALSATGTAVPTQAAPAQATPTQAAPVQVAPAPSSAVPQQPPNQPSTAVNTTTNLQTTQTQPRQEIKQ